MPDDDRPDDDRPDDDRPDDDRPDDDRSEETIGPGRPGVIGLVSALPDGVVTRPARPVPVVARIRFLDGFTMHVPGEALAWTRSAVEVRWEAPGQVLRRDWLPAADVRRIPDPEHPTSWTPPPSAG